jgi:NAD dependent epimerase/dehydratase family
MTTGLLNRGQKSPKAADNQILPTQRRDPSPSKGKKEFSLHSYCNRQSLMMLAIGLMMGYIVMPILLIEKNFPTLPEVKPQGPDGNARYARGGRSLEEGNVVLQRLMEDRDVMSHQSLPTSTTPQVMHTKTLPDHHRKKILVTGGAGFVGSHLVDKLMMQGHEVIVVDNFFTGQKKNIAHWLHHPNFR